MVVEGGLPILSTPRILPLLPINHNTPRSLDGLYDKERRLHEAKAVWEFGQTLDMTAAPSNPNHIINLALLDSTQVKSSSDKRCNAGFIMRIATLNMRGLGGTVRKRTVKKMVGKEKLDFLCILETNLEFMNHKICSPLWRGSDVDWICKDPNYTLENFSFILIIYV
ncbi:hypothetical protein Lal_00030254 [Lupinus albus]|nr:hypothetical protein Lal_00030254 [Lupinus albus]